MIRYVIKSVDGISLDNALASRLNQAHDEVCTKIEIDLDNLNSLLKVDLQAMATTMAISFTASETKASIIAKINEKVMTREEARAYISENSLTWNGPDPELNP
jgi:uncharacterized protein involved in exopolysaccharide biosynthesis